MKVGVIGSGGREHALCFSLKNSDKIKEIFCFPGNAGTNSIATNIDIDINNFEKLKDFIIQNDIDFIVVGPEKPLVDGIVDYFDKFNIKVKMSKAADEDSVIIEPTQDQQDIKRAQSEIDPLVERESIVGELLKYLSIRVGMTVKQKLVQNQPMHHLELKLFKHI